MQPRQIIDTLQDLHDQMERERRKSREEARDFDAACVLMQQVGVALAASQLGITLSTDKERDLPDEG